MAKPYDPFAASVGAEYLQPAGSDALTKGARSLVAGFGQARVREAKRDPLQEEMTGLSRRKADLSRVSEALKNQRTTFIDSEGADLFERDPLTGRAMIDKTTEKPIDRIQTLRDEMIQMRVRAGQGDAAARDELPVREKEFKLKLDKWTRLQSEGDRVSKAALETENRLGELATQRLYSTQPAPLPGLGQSAPSPSPTPAPVATQPQAQPAPARPEASAPKGVPFSETSEPVAAQPTATTPAPDATIASLVDLHQRVKTQEGIMADGRTSEHFKAGAAARATEFRRKFADGMSQLDPTAQQRVTDAVRDPTFMEQLGNFAARAAEGVGTTIVDTGEFAARNAARGANLLGAEIDPNDNTATRFADAMRSVAAEWGPDVAKEVQAKLDTSVSGSIGQGIGSAAALMAPGMLLGRVAKIAGMSDKAAKVLVTAGVAGAGAGATGNALRREAETNLSALMQAGEITADEFQRGVNQAEAIGALIGTSEVIPIGKFAERLAQLPGGQSFVNGLFRKLATEGVEGASNWVRGAGREALHRIGRAAGEGFEEALQEFGQSAAENLTASGSFGNVAWDPERATFSAEGSEQAGVGFIVGALLGAATGGRIRRDGPDAPAGDPTSTPPPTTPSAAPEAEQPTASAAPTSPAPAPVADDDASPEVDAELLAELLGQSDQPAISPQPAPESVSVGPDNGAVAEEPAAPASPDEEFDDSSSPFLSGLYEAVPDTAGEVTPVDEALAAPARSARETEDFNRRVVGEIERFKGLGIPVNPETRRAASAIASAESSQERGLLRQGVSARFGKTGAVPPSGKPKPQTMKSLDALDASAFPTERAAPATFLGIQQGATDADSIELYNLTDSIPGHPKGSTVSRQTLEQAGYNVPIQPLSQQVSSSVEQQTHNLRDDGSNPPPATISPEPASAPAEQVAPQAQTTGDESVPALAIMQEPSSGAGGAPDVDAGREADAAPAPISLEGEKIDREWTAFSDDSGSLNIPRAEMPQIKSEARGALTQFLKARGVEHTNEEVAPSDLKPTQAEFSAAKVKKSVKRREEEGGQGRPIIVSSDNHIVDGHHQWMAALEAAPGEPFKVIRLNAPIRDVLAQIKEFPSAEAASGASAAPISTETPVSPASETASVSETTSQPPAATSDQPQESTASTPAPAPAAGAPAIAAKTAKRPPSRKSKKAEPASAAPDLAPRQSFDETKTALLQQIDEAIAKAPIPVRGRATMKRYEELSKKLGISESEIARREVPAGSVGTISFTSGNSKYKVANDLKTLSELRKRIAAPIRQTPLARAAENDSQKEFVRRYKDPKTPESEKRLLIDGMTDRTLEQLGLSEKYTRVAPGVVMPKDAAAALAALKRGETPIVDVQASRPGDMPLDPAAPNAQQWVDIDERSADEKDLERLKAFERVVNREQARRGAVPVRLHLVGLDTGSGESAFNRRGNRPTDFGETARRLSRAFNKRIIFFRSSDEIGIAGMTAKSLANTILVNVDARQPMQAIVGHELGHNIKNHSRKWWEALRDSSPAMPENYSAMKVRQGYAVEAAIEEWVSDMLGERFDDPGFWESFRTALESKEGKTNFAKNVQTAREAAEWIAGWLNKLTLRIKKLFIRSDRFITDMEGIRNRFATILADYAEVSSSLPENPAFLGIRDDELVASRPGTDEDGDFSRFPDSLRDRGQPVDRIEYEARTQKDVAAEAKRVIESRGEKLAEAEALSRSSTMAGDTRVAVIGELIARRAAEMKGAKPEDVVRITKEMNRLVAAAQPSLATEAGQQISMFQHAYKDPRVAAVMEYTKDVQDRQKRQMGEATDKAVDEAVSTLNESAREAAKSIEKNLPQVLRPVKVGRSIWQRYRDSVAEKLVKLVEDRTTPPADQPPLADFTRRVAEQIRTRMEPILPEQAQSARPQPSTMEIIREAMENKAKYRDVFDTVRAAFVEQYGADSVIVESIDQVLGDIGVRPYSEKLLKKATREAFDAMKLNVRDLARQHVTKTNATAADLADALVSVAGLTGADAKQVAADLDAKARELIAESRQKALEALKRRHDTPKAKKVLDAISRTTELNNLGALARADLADVVARTLRLPSVDPERMQRISEIADRVETAENASLRAKAETELLNELRRARGITKTDVATAVWFANMLSGYTTQLANVQGNAFNGVLQLATVAAANPRQMGQAVRGYIEGFGEGWTQAKAIVKTGRGSREFDAKTGTASPTLELVDYTKDFPDLNKTIAKGLNAHARVLSYVFRFMKAVDATFYYPAREAYARVVTTKLLAAEYQGPELHRKVREMLGTAPDQFIAAQKRAKAEGFTGVDLALRVANIIEETRRSSDIGRTAAEQSERFALETTFNNEPEGWAGVLYQHLAKLTEGFRPGGVPVLKAFLPFLRIPTNLFNASMNYTPLGAVRAMRGVVKPELVGEKVEIERREFTEDERNRLYVQSIGGSLAMGALAAMALRGAADDEEDFFTITATGPADWRQRQQLEATGWKPHSIKLGDAWISYKDSPLLTPLAVVGNVVDSIRYQKAKDDATLGSHVIDSVLKAPRVIFDTSMLSGLGQLFDFLQDRSGAARLTQFLVRTPTSVVIPNLLSQIDRTFNPEAREADGPLGAAGAALPFVRNTGSVKTDVLGEPVERAPLERFIKLEANDPVREVLRDKNVFISVPSKNTKVGNRVMEPEEYRDFVRISGERIRQRLSGSVQAMRRLNREQVEKLVERVTQEERTRAKQMVARGLVGRN